MTIRNRPHKDLSDKFIDGGKNSPVPVSIDQMEKAIDQLIKDVNGDVPIIHQDQGFNAKRQVLDYYKFAYGLWRSNDSRESKIFSFEAKAHRQSLKYRIATTICIGLLIMGLYGFAQWVGIKMPLKF